MKLKFVTVASAKHVNDLTLAYVMTYVMIDKRVVYL